MVATNTPLSFGGDQTLVIEKFELFPKKKNVCQLTVFAYAFLFLKFSSLFFGFLMSLEFFELIAYIQFYNIFFGKDPSLF